MKTENSRRQMTLTDQISEPKSFSPMIKSFEKSQTQGAGDILFWATWGILRKIHDL